MYICIYLGMRYMSPKYVQCACLLSPASYISLRKVYTRRLLIHTCFSCMCYILRTILKTYLDDKKTGG